MSTNFNPIAPLTPTTQGSLSSLDANSFDFTDFTYPVDLASAPGLQHFVIFYINQSYQTQFNFNPPPPTGSSVTNPIASIVGSVPNQSQATQNFLNDNSNSIASATNQVATTNKAKMAICLYMPPAIQSQLEVNWSPENLGFSGNQVQSALGGVKGFSDIVNRIKGLNWQDLRRDATQSIINNGVDALNAATNSNISGGASAGLQLAINPHAEVLFRNVNFRGFEFQWQFTPRNSAESIVVDNIIQAFRFYMAPEINQGNAGPFFIYPAEFDIQFWSNGQPNNYINKISTCALTSAIVNYTANGVFTAFKPEAGMNGVTVQTNLTLRFVELELMTKSRINAGY